METSTRRRPERVFVWLLIAQAGLSIFSVVFVILSRIDYRYGLERMEGASLVQVGRLLDHQALYLAPSLDYVPLIYPPVYFYLSALLAKFIGLSFVPLRMVSAFAFAGCLAFAFLLIEKVTKDKPCAWIGAGFLAATYPLSGAWFDIARVDTLFVFFCLGAIWYSSREDSWSVFLSGLFWILAIFTKQTGLIALLFSLAYLLVFSPRINFLHLLWTGLLGVGAYLACSAIWGKWFEYFIFYLPSLHRLQKNTADISNSVFQLVLPLLLAILVSWLPFLVDSRLLARKPARYLGYMTLVFFGLSLLGRLNLGGFTNVYMPAHAMTAVMLGIGLAWWRQRFELSGTPASSLVMGTLYLLCILQFVVIYYDPRAVIPGPIQAEEWMRLERFIERFEGNVLAPEVNYLTLYTQKPSFLNEVALEEILGVFGDAEPIESAHLRLEMSHALEEKNFDFVLLQGSDGLGEEVSRMYDCVPFSSQNHAGFPPVIVREYRFCYPPGAAPEPTGPLE